MYQRARGANGDRPVRETREKKWQPQSERSGPQRRVAIDAENPLHRLTAEQIEEIGREFDELHEQVKADLGDRDARYIRSMIAMQRRLALMGRAELIASRWRIPWALGAATLGLAKILENMEIGHNVLHGQWDWMNDPVINSRAWDWDTASTAEAWRHSHNYIHHTFTNILGKDHDLGYEIMRIDPHQRWNPVYLLQPFYNIAAGDAVRVGGRGPRPRLRRRSARARRPEAGAQGAEGDRRQGARPDPQGLHRLAGDQRARDDAVEAGVLGCEGALGRRPRAKGGDRESALRSGARAAPHSDPPAAGRAALVPRAVRAHADRRRRREHDPQRVVLRDHLLRPLPRPDLHVHPGGGQGRDAAAAGTSDSWSGPPTSTAGRSSTC